MNKRSAPKLLPVLVILLIFLCTCSNRSQKPQAPTISRPEIQNFSFVHVTDTHVSPVYTMPTTLEELRSYSCVSSIKDLGDVMLEPYGITAPKPSLIIHTGDITEYGFPGVTWPLVEKYFEGNEAPIYFIPGNHDHTWVSDPRLFKKRYGGLNYSFDYGGCHFIGICSASLQEPLPSFGREVILFLKDDLENVHPSTPVFVFYHHPLIGNEFCSRYDVDRVIDVLRGYNVILLMDGHWHKVETYDYWGFNGAQGGVAFNKKPPPRDGFNIVCIQDKELFVAHKNAWESHAVDGLVRKKIPVSNPYPDIEIISPPDREVIRKTPLSIEVSISGIEDEITNVSYSIDDEIQDVLPFSGQRFKGEASLAGLANGAHFLRIACKDAAGKEYYKSTAFFLEKNDMGKWGRAKWRFRMKGGSKATPLIYKGVVYVGANDGLFYALDEQTGGLEWTFDAGAEILTTAAAWNDLILFGAGNGKFFALNREGETEWSFDAGAPVYSSPAVDQAGVVYFGTNEAKLIALQAQTGKHLWTNSDAKYSVESKPVASSNYVCFGAWDGYVYCLNKENGETVWKLPGPKCQKRMSRYYAPADNGPVVSGEHLFIADRGYVAGKYKLNGAFEKNISGDCSALCLSGDGKALYLRARKNAVTKVDLDGDVLWESLVMAGRMPVSPTVKDGTLYVCTNSGRLYAMDEGTGMVKWEYQVSPKLYVMSGIGADNGVTFTTTLDGYVTAITN